MPDSYTSIYGLTKPEQGSSRDTWGTKLNADLDMIDQLLAFALPIGMMLDFGGGTAPSGYLICDGRTVSRITYSDLFNAIGTTWGAGDGSTTFALPNVRGRATVAPGAVIDQNGNSVSYTVGQSLGAVSNQIAVAHLPNTPISTNYVAAHSHGGYTAPGGNHIHYTDAQGDHSHTGYTDAIGNHTHGVNDPGHQHGIRLTTGSGAWQFVNINGTQQVQGGNTDAAATGISIQAAGIHQHVVQTYNAGSHAHNISASGNLQLPINPDGSHAHSFQLGSGSYFAVLQPILVCTKIIFAGKQAAVLTVTADAVAPTRLLRAPMRGVH